jgi:hypothetical protein
MQKHGSDNETQARRISMPKNRIGPEMIPHEFVMSIASMPRSHRHEISGITISPYESNAQTQARALFDQALMKILNSPCSNHELWAAFGWEIENHEPRKHENRDAWKFIKDELDTRGYVYERRKGSGAKYSWYPKDETSKE